MAATTSPTARRADDVPIYNHERYAWLASHGFRAGYVDEAVQEFGHGDSVADDIGRGIYMERSEVYGQVLVFLRDRAEVESLAQDDDDEEESKV